LENTGTGSRNLSDTVKGRTGWKNSRKSSHDIQYGHQQAQKAQGVKSEAQHIKRHKIKLNNVFDTTIEHIKYGAELGQQTVNRKAALNDEFSMFLKLLKKEGLPTGPMKPEFHHKKRGKTHRSQALQIPQDTANADGQQADLLCWQKAGLLDDKSGEN
jgi:hypothetical protein